MKVEAASIGITHPRIARNFRHDAQLDLAVVRNDEYVARRGAHGTADKPVAGNIL